MNIKTHIKYSVILTLGALAAQAHASGYHFGTQSVSAQATSNASGAEAADPSTIFHNAAGLTKLDGTQATININIANPSVKYKNAEASYPDGEAIEGETEGKIAKSVQFVPHLYASHKINDQVSVGLGAYVPFGSGTEYNHDSVLRYNLNELGLQTMAIQPTVAYKLNDRHSFAVGLVAQHTTAELRQYANFGPAVKQSLGASSAALSAGIAATEAAGGDASTFKAQLAAAQAQKATLTAQQTAVNNRLSQMPGMGNGTADGYAKVKGDDWGFGYTLSWLWDINDQARVGMNFRSKVNHTLKGDAEWHLVGDAFNDPALGATIQQGIRARGYAEKEDASVKITTPESLSIHGMYKLNPKWNVYGDATWTRHSRFNEANLYFGNEKTVLPARTGDINPDVAGAQSNVTTLTPKWRNTWKFAVGASYQYSDPLQLRFGLAYDQTPVKNADLRMNSMPDNDRILLSLGAKYDINRNHTINAAYTRIFIKNASANVNGYCGGSTAADVACVSSKTQGSADFKSGANLFGLQYTYKF